MVFGNRHSFFDKATTHKASAVDRHRTPPPPGRCRDVPELSPAQQITKLFAAHQRTKDASKQTAAHGDYELWDSRMELLQTEEQLAEECSAHAATKEKLWATEEKLDEVIDENRQKDDKIAALLLQLSVVEAQRDEYAAGVADLRPRLQAADATIAEQARTISNMRQQQSSHIAAMSLLYGELTTQVPPAPTSAQLQQGQGPQRYTSLFNALQGSLPTPSSATSLLPSLMLHSSPSSSRTSSSSTAGDPPHVPAPALQPPLPVVSGPTAAPTNQGAPDSDIMDTIKATASTLLAKTSQGVRQGWTKAVAWSADNGIKLGSNSSFSSGVSSGLLSRWGSVERTMSAASSRRCSNSSSSSSTGFSRVAVLSSSDC